MNQDDLRHIVELQKVVKQVKVAISCIEAGMPLYPNNPEKRKVNQGYEIGDFVITPRFPKTDFQG